jgi:hypothetical protein
MDGERWSKLPVDLLKKVFTSLSLVSIAKARTVCRNWHALVQNSDFFQLRKHFSLRCPALEHHWSLLLLWEPDQRLVFSYNVASRKWERRFSFSCSRSVRPFLFCQQRVLAGVQFLDDGTATTSSFRILQTDIHYMDSCSFAGGH